MKEIASVVFLLFVVVVVVVVVGQQSSIVGVDGSISGHVPRSAAAKEVISSKPTTSARLALHLTDATPDAQKQRKAGEVADSNHAACDVTSCAPRASPSLCDLHSRGPASSWTWMR